MKKITKLWVGTLLFVVLFYRQDVGLNAGILGLFVWLLFFLTGVNKSQQKEFFLLSVMCIGSALAFAWYGDPFSFFAMIISLLVLGLRCQYPQIRIVLYPFLWFLNYAGFIFKFFSFKFWLPQKISGNNVFKKVLALVLIPAFFTGVFLTVYTSGSDIFYRFFQNIAFDLNFFQIFFLTCLGFFLFFNLWFVFVPKIMIRYNAQLGMNFNSDGSYYQKPTFSFLEINFERKSGEISLVLLNVLLLFFIITYNYEQFFTATSGATLSDEVHQRVATIIFSIVLAIGLIMFYFKSTFNFDVKAGLLKKLAYLWIFLNVLLIVSAFVKNTEYVSSLGLTFKRIGVYVFLCLSLLGLFVTFWKIYFRKTNAFLLSTMLRSFFFTFVILSWINFSWIVTKYNITFHKATDVAYLRNMDYNTQILWDTYSSDPEWQDYFSKEKGRIEKERTNSFLSRHLYYYSLSLQ